MKKWIGLLLLTGVALSDRGTETSLAGAVDFRYALPWWQTAICLPDDPDKTLVGREGQLLFDYGHGGVRNFALCIQPDLAGVTVWGKQDTLSPRVPVVQTWKTADGVEILEETFVAIQAAVASRVVRHDGGQRIYKWAKPAKAFATAFTGVAAGEGRPIKMTAKAPDSGSATIVFGLCEGWHKEAGKRPLVLQVEGAAPLTVDPVKDFGFNQPGLYRLNAKDVNRDGALDVTISSASGATDRNPILNAFWVFDGRVPSDDALLKGKVKAWAFYPEDTEPERQAVILMTLKNTGKVEASPQPVLRIQSVDPTAVHFDGGRVAAGASTFITASEPWVTVSTGSVAVAKIAPVSLKPGASRQVAFFVDRQYEPVEGRRLRASDAVKLRDRAEKWWQTGGLPFDTIEVPDAGIQGMLESCVRNIWQAREIKEGKTAFHVGPTCYRGLWIVDGAFLLESAALVGRAMEARAGIEYVLGRQRADGSFDVLGKFWKENGIVLWTVSRHAMLTQDKAWLEAVWPKLERTVEAIKRLRERSRAAPPDLDDGLMPTGNTDGGIGGNNAEYSNVYWNLAGLNAIIGAAEWLGKTDEAATWRKEYDDFMAVFRKAAERDMATDPFGNRYLPTIMGEAGKKYLPQRAQWAFMHAVYPGQIFAKDDALAQGNLAMLRATKRQGLVFGTGWDPEGIWTYAASFYGHAVLWQGQGQEAAQVLYDYANHACPTRVWREEQRPVGKGGNQVGDMPHNWASAEFIRLTTHLLELDRGDELHLLEGLPAKWLGAGMTTRLNGVATPFGPLYMTLNVNRGGTVATLDVKPLAANCKAVVVHLPDGSTRQIVPREGGRIEFAVPIVSADAVTPLEVRL
jgi:hypothetical protein